MGEMNQRHSSDGEQASRKLDKWKTRDYFNIGRVSSAESCLTGGRAFIHRGVVAEGISSSSVGRERKEVNLARLERLARGSIPGEREMSWLWEGEETGERTGLVRAFRKFCFVIFNVTFPHSSGSFRKISITQAHHSICRLGHESRGGLKLYV